MPQVFKVGSYWVYFWANENEPLDPCARCTGGTQQQRHQDLDHQGGRLLPVQ